LDAKLEEMGSSLAQQKRKFGERALAQQWLRQNVPHDEEVGHAEMLAYYRDHLADYEFEATARWEELAVRFDKFSSKAEAYRALAALGNEVFQGADFAEIAKARSQGVTADEGGQYDWTTRGALVSEKLNKALFTLPVGQLSPIIETETGFHIIRVLERRAAGRTSFVEAQVEIKKKIEQERSQKRMEQYMAQLRAETRVWTIFDDMPELTELSRRAQRPPR
jgi:parvulin-like peptidyl-prolyl isomerase